MLPNTKPPNREWYFNRCAELTKVAGKPEMFPPFLVAANCHFVLIRIYGGPWRVLWVLLWDRLEHEQERFRSICWDSWHRYICQRTQAEIMERYEVWLEKETGYDCREWPDEIEIEEAEASN